MRDWLHVSDEDEIEIPRWFEARILLLEMMMDDSQVFEDAGEATETALHRSSEFRVPLSAFHFSFFIFPFSFFLFLFSFFACSLSDSAKSRVAIHRCGVPDICLSNTKEKTLIPTPGSSDHTSRTHHICMLISRSQSVDSYAFKQREIQFAIEQCVHSCEDMVWPLACAA